MPALDTLIFQILKAIDTAYEESLWNSKRDKRLDTWIINLKINVSTPFPEV